MKSISLADDRIYSKWVDEVESPLLFLRREYPKHIWRIASITF